MLDNPPHPFRKKSAKRSSYYSVIKITIKLTPTNSPPTLRVQISEVVMTLELFS